MDLSIIIPTCNREEIFKITLDRALESIENISAEIIVVNDGGESSALYSGKDARVRIEKNSGSGVAAARNFGASIANAGLLLFLDDDMLLSPSKLQQALEVKKNFPDEVFNFNWHYPENLQTSISKTKFGRFLINEDLTTMKGWSKDPNWDDKKPFICNGIAGATLLINKSDYNRIGGYDASYPYAGAEDFDFSQRLKSAGLITMVDPRVVFFHNEMNKTSLKGWCSRSERAALTRKHAVLQGYNEMELRISPARTLIYKTGHNFRGVLFLFSDLIPNSSICDGVYAKFAHLLIGIHLWKGYSSYKASHISK